MSSLFLDFFEFENVFGFRFLKSKEGKPCGDNSSAGETLNFNYLINCDGVSSTSSPERSSQILVEAFESHFDSISSKKPRLGKITELLIKRNKDYLKKDLASTFDLFVFSKKFNYYLGLGDSSFYIFEPNGELTFQNWIHNQSKIIEDHFGSKVGEDHVLVNCIGIQNPRFEITENIKLNKGSQILFHSDGLEQFFDSFEKIREHCQDIYSKKEDGIDQIKTWLEKLYKNNDDDLSIVYCVKK